MTILPNGVAVCDGDTHFAVWIQESGKLVHDSHHAEVLRLYIQRYKVRTCIDGGANIGTLTVPMLEQGCRVIAFEPNDEARACLTHNTKRWAGPDLEIRPEGLAERRGISAMWLQENAGASWLMDAQPEEEIVRQSVPLISIDEYLAPVLARSSVSKVEKIGLIKLDIEGYEIKALEGARRTIERWHPVLALEVNRGTLERCGHTAPDLFSLLESHGYSWRHVYQDRYFPEQYDIIAWKP